jgi:hypothetical protein
MSEPKPWFLKNGVKTVIVDESDLEEQQPGDEVSPESRIDEIVSEGATQLSEVERRLDKARYYRLLIDSPLFTDSTAAGEEVLAEIREFVGHRMNVLVGIEQEKQVISDRFDDEQIVALQAMANRVLGRTSVQAITPAAPPAVRPVSVAPPAPAVRPVAPPAQPKTAAPSPAPVAKPKPAPQPEKPAEKPAPEKKPRKKAEKKKAASSTEKSDDPIHLPRVKDVEDVDIEQFAWDQKVIVGNKLWKVIDDGNGNRKWRDVTPIAVPQGMQPIPMPTAVHAEMHQTAQAYEIEKGADRAVSAGRAVGTNDTIVHPD